MGADVITPAGRDRWPARDWCSLERALELVGTRSAMVLLREAFFGATRFEELTRRAGVTEAVAAKRLKQLVAGGVLRREPYQEPGSRTRFEYVLTERGRALYPVVVALIRWGDTLDRGPGGVELVHEDCGAPLEPHVRCAAGHDVPPASATARLTAG